MRWVNPPSERAASKSPNATSKAVLSLPRTTTSNVRVDTALTLVVLESHGCTHRMVKQQALGLRGHRIRSTQDHVDQRGYALAARSVPLLSAVR